MGIAKDRWISDISRGFYGKDNCYVCSKCLYDHHLKACAVGSDDIATCNYCGSITNVLSFNELMTKVISAIELSHQDVGEAGMPWSEDDYGWKHAVSDGYDIVDSLDVITENESLISDIRASISDRQWVNLNYYYPTRSEMLIRSWQAFVELVKHRRRYTFFLETEPPSDEWRYGPAQLFSHSVSLAEDLSMIREICPDDIVYRARMQPHGEEYTSVSSLGPPAAALARVANRMSPAGIPMFYGSFDETTAMMEVVHTLTAHHPLAIKIAPFSPISCMRVLDLTHIPSLPSPFSDADNWQIEYLRFLRQFAEAVSEPIRRDGSENSEYVPTQVFSEYVRYQHLDSDIPQIFGILYPSAVVDGGASCVFYLSQSDCYDQGTSNNAEIGLIMGTPRLRKWPN